MTRRLWDILGIIADVWLAVAFLMIAVIGMMILQWAWRRMP